jgi:hypothetical protein
MLDILISIAGWLATLYLFRPSAVRRSEWHKVASWLPRLFVLSLALSLSLQVDAWTPAIDSALHINNLSWLVGYMFAVVSGYSGEAGWGSVRHYLSSRRVAIICITTVAAFILLFPWLMQEPEQLHDAFATTAASLLFREISYVWLVLMAGEGHQMVSRYLQLEDQATGHFRFGLVIFGFRSLLAFAFVRGISSLVVFFDPNWSLARLALISSDLMLASCVLFFALFHAPRSWLAAIARIWTYLDQRLALHELEKLRTELVALTSPLPWSRPTRSEVWSQPSYALYCTLIDILDRRSLLLGAMQTGTWSEPLTPAVTRLLEELPETLDWVELLQHIRGIAKRGPVVRSLRTFLSETANLRR